MLSGLDGLVSKKKADFIGRRSLEQSYPKGPNRKHPGESRVRVQAPWKS
jgi:glycine cleavage system aminomethyltransferase T